MINVSDEMKTWLHNYPKEKGTPSVGEIAAKAQELAYALAKEAQEPGIRLAAMAGRTNARLQCYINVIHAINKAVSETTGYDCSIVPDGYLKQAEQDARQ